MRRVKYLFVANKKDKQILKTKKKKKKQISADYAVKMVLKKGKLFYKNLLFSFLLYNMFVTLIDRYVSYHFMGFNSMLFSLLLIQKSKNDNL